MNGLVKCRGALVAFEGCDRCGKSTQCAKLVEYLRSKGRAVEHVRFPGLCRPAKLHAFGVIVPHFTCTSRANFPYIFYKFTHFHFSCSPHMYFFKIAAVASQVHAF